MTTLNCPSCGVALPNLQFSDVTEVAMVSAGVSPPPKSERSHRRNFGKKPSHPTIQAMALTAVERWFYVGGTNAADGELLTTWDVWARYMDWATRRNLIWLTKRQVTTAALKLGALERVPGADGGENRWKYRQRPDYMPVWMRSAAGQRGLHLVSYDPVFEPWMADSVDPWKFPWIEDAGLTPANVSDKRLAELRMENFRAPDAWGNGGEAPPWRVKRLPYVATVSRPS